MDRFNVNITRSRVTATKVFEDGAYEPAFTRATAFIEEAHARTPPKGLENPKLAFVLSSTLHARRAGISRRNNDFTIRIDNHQLKFDKFLE